MNLGGDHLQFAFDKAELRPEDRELLTRETITSLLDERTHAVPTAPWRPGGRGRRGPK